MTITSAVRCALIVVVLLLLPTVVYENTISHRYGFRDDYSILRETHEEPGKIMRVCTGMARPLYGFLLENSFARFDRLEDLSSARQLTALLLGIIASLLYLVLRAQKWDAAIAALIPALFTLLPGAQVMVSWAIAWPPVMAMGFAVAGFGCAEKAHGAGGALKRVGWWITGLGLIAASALTYQVSSFFYLVPLAAGLCRRLDQPKPEFGRWLGRHFALLGGGLAVALTVMLALFASGVAEKSSRIAISYDVGETLGWFLRFPLPNALALFALEGNGTRGALYAAAVFLTTTLLLAGVIVTGRKHGGRRAILAVTTMLILLPIAYGVNLLSTERLPSYRTLLPLSGLVLVFVATSLRRTAGRTVTLGVLGALTLLAGWAARRQPFELIARPQSAEFSLMEEGARKMDPAGHSSVFVITPMLAEASAVWRVGDEFGSLSTNSDWVAKEMFAVATKEIFGTEPVRYVFDSGQRLPRDRHYDVTVDMGRLREFQPK